jgi:hypothetical protein
MLYENLKKGGIVEKRGEEETKSMPQVPVVVSARNKHIIYLASVLNNIRCN